MAGITLNLHPNQPTFEYREPFMAFGQMTDREIWDIAIPIMDNLMNASTHIDHARHVRDLTNRLRNIVTPEHLAFVCKQYQAEKGLLQSVNR